MTFVWTLIGAVAGALIGGAISRNELEGALFGGAAGALLGLIIGVMRWAGTLARVRQLEAEVGTLRQRLVALEAAGAAPTRRTAPDLGWPATEAAAAADSPETPSGQADHSPPPVPEPVPERTPTGPAGPPRAAAFDITLDDEVLEAAAERIKADPASHATGAGPEDAWLRAEVAGDTVSPPPSPLRDPLGFLLRGNWIARIGVAILFTGIAFLAKYAADSGLFPVELRLAGIAGIAIALTVAGWRLRQHRRDYALVLQGGGVAVLYLTVFAALRLYELLPAALAAALLIAIAVAAGVLAVRQDARVLAVIGSVGGFAAPVLASTGGGSHVALFGFYLVLNLGILAVSWFRAWRELNLLGFAFTFGIGSAWGASHYRPGDFATVEPFLVANFLLYVVVAVLFALRQPPRLRGFVDGTLVFGVPIATFALQHRLVEPYEFGAAFSALAMAALYIGLGGWVLRRLEAPLRLLGEAFLAIGVGFATLAIPLGLDARATAAAWALEGAAALWVGVRQGRRLPRAAGLALQLAAGVSLFIAHADVRDLEPVLNGRVLGMTLIAFSALLSVRLLERAREQLHASELPALPLLAAYGLLAWYGMGVLEVGEFVDHGHRGGGLLLFAAVSAGVMYWLAARTGLEALSVPALLLVPAGFGIAFITAAEDAHPLASAGLAGWPLAFGVVYLALRERPEDTPGVVSLLHSAALWLLAGVLGWEAAHQAHALLGTRGAWVLAALALAPAALTALVLQALDRAFSLPGALPRVYLGPGLGPIAAVLVLWTLYACVAHDGDPWPLGYLPLLNPLDIAIGLVLLTLAAWQRRWLAVQAPDKARDLRRLAWRAGAGLAFLWLNAMLARAAHFWGGVPYEVDDLLASAGYQAALAVLWGGLGISGMVLGARRSKRVLWVTGASLMGLVVIKLLVFDLANTGTVARIVSFMAIGGLLLLVGYLAPVPPREELAASPPPGTDGEEATR